LKLLQHGEFDLDLSNFANIFCKRGEGEVFPCWYWVDYSKYSLTDPEENMSVHLWLCK